MAAISFSLTDVHRFTLCAGALPPFRLLLLTAVLSGCALQVPMSEGLVFKDPASRTVASWHPAEVGFPLSATFPSERAFGRATSEYSGADPSPNWRVGLPLPAFVFTPSDRVAVSLTPGGGFVGSSIDATARLTHADFVTVGGNIAGSYEVIAQRRVLAFGSGGVGLGAYHRRERFGIEGLELQPSAIVAIRSVGARVSFQLPLTPGGGDRLRGFASAGYAYDHDAAMAAIGLALSLPNPRRRRR